MSDPTCSICQLTRQQRALLNVIRRAETQDLLHAWRLTNDREQRAAARALFARGLIATNPNRTVFSTTEEGRRTMTHLCRFPL